MRNLGQGEIRERECEVWEEGFKQVLCLCLVWGGGSCAIGGILQGLGSLDSIQVLWLLSTNCKILEVKEKL